MGNEQRSEATDDGERKPCRKCAARLDMGPHVPGCPLEAGPYRTPAEIAVDMPPARARAAPWPKWCRALAVACVASVAGGGALGQAIGASRVVWWGVFFACALVFFAAVVATISYAEEKGPPS